MVGRFTLSSTNHPASELRNSDVTSPPPSYRESTVSSLILSETTTTRTEVVTTTQTTTQFFSLPLWRKRSFIPPSSERSAPTEHGIIPPRTPPSALMIEKALPPTPKHSAEDIRKAGGSSNQNLDTELRNTITAGSSSPVSRKLSKDERSLSPSQSTAALAHASLGLGLPHVIPYHYSSSSSSEVSTIAFKPTVATMQRSPSGIRRAQSAQKFGESSSSEPPTSTGRSSEDGRPRARGISFGTSSFLSFGTDTKAKGKEKEISASHSPQALPRVISRRTSFWTRKKSIAAETLPQVARDKTHLHPLPHIEPISPFKMDINTPSSVSPVPPETVSQHSRGLSRSHSDRANLYRHAVPTPEGAMHFTLRHGLASRPQKRPSTADPSVPHSSRSTFAGNSHPSISLSSSASSYLSVLPRNSADSHRQSSRPRAQTNPPMLHRLSLSLFSSSTSPSSFSPSTKSSATSSVVSPNISPIKKAVNIPKPMGDAESPDTYLHRLLSVVNKAEVAGILASSADPFYVQALRRYIGQFDFVDDPLDVALRKLLMDVGLPRETQQIDRVIEGFAARYMQCNPSLFTSEDHPYILAFSLIMLHTDAFNKSNKRKMTKADYIKNTRLPGVAQEVLDCFFDNIVFAPFIYIEDPVDVNGQRGLSSDVTSNRVTPTIGHPNTNTNNINASMLGKGNKIDPYYLIANNLLGPLRVNIEQYVPLNNPYSYEGTAGAWDEEELQRIFSKANEVEVEATDTSRSSQFFSLGASSVSPTQFANELGTLSSNQREVWTVKVTKVGVLNRKDDVLEGGKKASNRKWKPWSVVLTGSQLLFFRDSSWANTLLSQSFPPDGNIFLPQSTLFKPDELLSVKDAIAVIDGLYTKYENTMRFVMADGRQILLQALASQELNQWISRINYASAFKSAGVRMRPLGMSGKDVQLTGVAAATSHLHDMQQRDQLTTPIHKWNDNDTPHELMSMLSSDFDLRPESSMSYDLAASGGRRSMKREVPIAPEVDGADQFKATFDQVKADLAAGRSVTSEDGSFNIESRVLHSDTDVIVASPVPTTDTEFSRLPSRSQIVQMKVQELESRIGEAQSQLDSDLRLVRNIATLTPFQKTTRDRLLLTVESIAKRVTQVRLDITKLVCHRDVLSSDLMSEDRVWNRARRLALKAATDTLQSKHSVPQMTLSFHNAPSSQFTPPKLDIPSPSRPESSSACDSFHTAMDFGPDWPSADDITSSLLSTSQLFDSPRCSSAESSSSFPFPVTNGGPTKSADNTVLPANSSSEMSSLNTDEFRTQDKFHTARENSEHAEEWNRTRAAQRVSLVRLPSDFGLSTRFERHRSLHRGP